MDVVNDIEILDQDRTKRGEAETNDGSVFYSHIPSLSRPEIKSGSRSRSGPQPCRDSTMRPCGTLWASNA